jgi:hypothetical protein
MGKQLYNNSSDRDNLNFSGEIPVVKFPSHIGPPLTNNNGDKDDLPYVY